MESNQGPSAYQHNALPLGQPGLPVSIIILTWPTIYIAEVRMQLQ